MKRRNLRQGITTQNAVFIVVIVLRNTNLTWRLKAGIGEPEETSIARQRLGKQVSAATDTKATIEELLGTLLSIPSEQETASEDCNRLRILVCVCSDL
jgi:hypothetical protein